jgi:hypothetical protein
MNPALARVLGDIERHRHAFDLDSENLGRDLCKAATDGVQGCIAREESPDGTRWDDLSPHYEEWKRFQFPGEPIGVLHKHMADPHEVAGEVDAKSDEATVTYGISEQARLEATWFQDPENPNQPPRPFWGFTAESLAEVEKILDARFNKVVR